eukprot:TRINITY_DN5829_c0_g1_i1.p1 TRINITY_DN5829_c0_g1~~TRINITY_DN5829_c0_g1_i1.p1  ORF type:complete len:984 (+),score=237.70 TRINITY_DN5829_c0_g1_i1:216-2954(+)
MFAGPYGRRKVTYCDYTASGRGLECIEQYVNTEILPFYGNTHSTSSVVGHQSTLFRFEARQLIGRYVNARYDKDVVLFSGRGVTGALQHLLHILEKSVGLGSRSVVFVGPYEHHSAILPWREAGCKVVSIKENQKGNIDTKHLEEELILHKDFSAKIGCFSAASNVTGILTDTNEISILLHKHSALSIWDYATAGPYVEMDMNPYMQGVDADLVYKDAILISTHKFIGGPGTPGIMVVKKKLFDKKHPPSTPGGGTVFFVTDKDHRYLSNLYEREEGGTPDIVGSIKAGLVFKLKHSVGVQTIQAREHDFAVRAEGRLAAIPNLHLLGPSVNDVKKLAIFSFMISHPSNIGKKFLHYNFVCSLLSDLFGIQARGGCMCAGPYAQHLLGIDFDLAKKYEEELVERDHSEVIRPGFVRINFNYFISEEEFSFVLSALEFVAKDGWRFLSEYTFYEESNEWVHKKNRKFPDRRWLDSISFRQGKMQWPTQDNSDAALHSYQDYLEQAEVLASQIKREEHPNPQLLHPSAEALRWFLYPHEALSSGESASSPFQPRTYSTASPVAPKPPPSDPTAPEPSASCEATGECLPCARIMATTTSQYKSIKNKSTTSQKLRDQLGQPPDPSNQKKKPKAPLSPQKAALLEKKKIGKAIFSSACDAIAEFGMIKDGDRVLVGLSGGKDSLTLLNILLQIKQAKKWNFEIGATTVDPQTISYDPTPLIPYVKQLGVPYYYQSQGLIELAKETCPTSICAWCSRMKRGILCKTARKHGYNKIALGQHLDDLAESFLMYAFHNGKLDTMKASSLLKEGDLSIIRPFIYVRELQTKKYARLHSLPVITENCPACFAEPKERKRIKALLAAQENLFPLLFNSIRSTIHPLMHGRVNVKRQFIKEMELDGHTIPKPPEREENENEDLF